MGEKLTKPKAPHTTQLPSREIDSVIASTGISKEQLDQECDNRDFYEVAERAIDYQVYGPILGLSKTDITEQVKNPSVSHSVKLITAAVFEEWHKKNGSMATYYELVAMFLKSNNRTAAEKVCQMVKAKAQECRQQKVPKSYRDSFRDDLFHSLSDPDTPGFICPYCGKCTIEQFFSEKGCLNKKQGQLFPHLDVSSLNENEKASLEEKLLSDVRKMFTRFADFTVFTRDSIDNREVPLDKVIDTVLSLEASKEGIGSMVLEEQDQEKIQAAPSVAKVFTILRRYISFFNYEVIEHLIRHHGSTEDKKRLEEYLDAFKAFCQRNIFEVPPDVFSNSPCPPGKVFALKCTDQSRVTTLESAQQVKQRVAEIFSLNPLALQLCMLKKGCVELHFLIPTIVANHILPVSSPHCSALSKIGLKVLSMEEENIKGHMKKEHKSSLVDLESNKILDVTMSEELSHPTKELLPKSPDNLSLEFFTACKEGQTVTAQVLIDKGVNINEVLDGRSPLIAACEGGHTETAQLLIDKGADVNKTGQDGRSPLIAACEGGHTETAQLLIDKGVDVNKTGQDGRSPLKAACDGGHTKTAQLLIDKGADVHNSGWFFLNATQLFRDRRSPLLAACEGGHTATAQLLIDKGADVNKTSLAERLPLLAACEAGHTKTAQLLIDKGADVNKAGWDERSPLLAACEAGHTETAQLLIDKGANDVTRLYSRRSPLLAACEGGHTATAQLLIDKGADVNNTSLDGKSPLIAACEGGHTETAQLLIDRGADVNRAGHNAARLFQNERSPLLAACERGQTAIAQLLIDKGADVNNTSLDGKSPLMTACEGGHTETAQLLIDKGADVNKAGHDITRLSRNKRSPFLAACVGGPTETAQLLIDKEADVNKAGHATFYESLDSDSDVSATGEKASDELFSYKKYARHTSSQAGSSVGSRASRCGSSVGSVKSNAE